MQRIKNAWARMSRAGQYLLRDEDGATATEYAVMLAVIIVAALVGLDTFADGVHGLYVEISSALTLT